jgi:3-methylfumaryl-CoA hydratase
MEITETELIVDEVRCMHFSTLLGSVMGVPIDESLLFAPSWHWLFTHETPTHVELGLDGHPVTRPSGVPASYTRRLWASSTLQFKKLVIPESRQRLRYRTTVEPATLKQGQSGELAFVPTKIEIFDDTSLLLTENRMGVYRPDTLQPIRQNVMQKEATISCKASKSITFNEVDLFRYSMILRVSHRIHYDFIYTTQVEQYPGLVVHGPLLAQVLIYYALNHYPTLSITSMAVQTIKPNFLGSSVIINVGFDIQRNCVTAWATDINGVTSLKIEFR